MEQYFDAVDDTAWKRGRARADAAAERAVADATARAAAAEARAAAAEARADAAEVRADAAEVRADAAEAAAETASRSVIYHLRKDAADAKARADAADAQAVWHRYATDEGDAYFVCAATGEAVWELMEPVKHAWGAALDRARAESTGLRERARADAASLRAQRKELDTLRVDSEARLSEYALGMATAEAEHRAEVRALEALLHHSGYQAGRLAAHWVARWRAWVARLRRVRTVAAWMQREGGLVELADEDVRRLYESGGGVASRHFARRPGGGSRAPAADVPSCTGFSLGVRGACRACGLPAEHAIHTGVPGIDVNPLDADGPGIDVDPLDDFLGGADSDDDPVEMREDFSEVRSRFIGAGGAPTSPESPLLDLGIVRDARRLLQAETDRHADEVAARLVTARREQACEERAAQTAEEIGAALEPQFELYVRTLRHTLTAVSFTAAQFREAGVAELKARLCAIEGGEPPGGYRLLCEGMDLDERTETRRLASFLEPGSTLTQMVRLRGGGQPERKRARKALGCVMENMGDVDPFQFAMLMGKRNAKNIYTGRVKKGTGESIASSGTSDWSGMTAQGCAHLRKGDGCHPVAAVGDGGAAKRPRGGAGAAAVAPLGACAACRWTRREIGQTKTTKHSKACANRLAELEQSHGDAIASLRLLSKSCVPRMRAYVAAGDDVEAAIQRARDEHMPLMDITDDGDLPTDGEIQGLPVQPGLW